MNQCQCLSLFEDFFEFSSPADYAKKLIYTSPDETSETEKEKKNADETLNIIKKILDDNKDPQNNFHLASKVNKGKSELKFERSVAGRVKSRRQKLDII